MLSDVGGVLSVEVMHGVLYKLFAIEVFFCNVYLLIGLFFTVGLVYVLKI
jgi:hypothetical protein